MLIVYEAKAICLMVYTCLYRVNLITLCILHNLSFLCGNKTSSATDLKSFKPAKKPSSLYIDYLILLPENV